jgi:hypothetical protein
MNPRACVVTVALVAAPLLANSGTANGEWKPAQGPLMTRWAKDVSPDKVHPEYPRPHLERKEWLNLNGLWDYAIRPRAAAVQPESWDGQILVPFPIESALSGVMKTVGEANRLVYRRTFKLPTEEAWKNKRILLHFGAVDWECTVWVNGVVVGTHRGGYDPFSFDITRALQKQTSGSHEILVSVWDPTDASFQPRGKQVAKPHGIWYTSVTGIWQTVWLEPVPSCYITSLRIVPNVDRQEIQVTVDASQTPRSGALLTITTMSNGMREFPRKQVAVLATGHPFAISLSPARFWSTDDPWLYNFSVEVAVNGAIDKVTGYFAMRKIEVRKDVAGVNRLFLNNQPLFQLGPLDQGWWPDGLYTAPTDAALKYDIEITKKLGFNMCRKHVKVEPARWYYWCDKLGLLVWQDMPSGDRYIGANDADIVRSAESEATFRREWQAIIAANQMHPSIVAWVPFNEGWGQFKTNEILEFTKKLDPTRLVDGPSGWSDRGGGDMHDLHSYPGPGMFPISEKRASVLGEFGGLGLPLEGHLWLKKGNWGYRTYKDKGELAKAYRDIVGRLQGLRADGLAAAVYTQTTDVEIEVNGLMTYDRAVIKLPEDVAELHKKLYQPLPIVREVLATSQSKPQEWKYTTAKPAGEWFQPGFDASSWKTGPGGFGTKGTPGAVVRTQWNTPDIWLRREFEHDGAKLTDPHLRIHHDEDAEIYLNGKLVASVKGYTVNYVPVPFDKAARGTLQKGRNTLAVHCHQTGGGQYVDVGLVDLVPAKPNDAK